MSARVVESARLCGSLDVHLLADDRGRWWVVTDVELTAAAAIVVAESPRARACPYGVWRFGDEGEARAAYEAIVEAG